MRLSRPDSNDPTKRRHFEISIDSPFHILSCRATQANTALPAYSSPDPSNDSLQAECGCPGAPLRRRDSPPSFVPTLNSLESSTTGAPSGATTHPRSASIAGALAAPSAAATNGASQRHTWQPGATGLQRPQAAHIGGPQNPALSRPMHIIRAPSFAPPSFDQEDPPPPLETPPPQYDTIASPTNGLADYFARLSDAYSDSINTRLQTEDPDNSDSDTTEGARTPRGSQRVEQPLTPGALRSARSLDEARTWLPIDLTQNDFSLRRPVGAGGSSGRGSRASNLSNSSVATEDFMSAVGSPLGSRAVSRANARVEPGSAF